MFGLPSSSMASGHADALVGLGSASARPLPNASAPSSVFVSAVPIWLLITLCAVVVLVIVAMFALTAYNLSAPRSTLKKVIGTRPPRFSGLASIAIGRRQWPGQPSKWLQRPMYPMAPRLLRAHNMTCYSDFSRGGMILVWRRSQVCANESLARAVILAGWFSLRV